MNRRKLLIALLAMMAIAFFAVGNVSAQTLPETEVVETEDSLEDDLDLDELNPENEVELQILLTTLGERYEVDILVLTGLIDEGYGVQEIWLALEIQKASEMTLEEALVVAEGTDGHGWGVLAQALGIKPGSVEFMELKGKIVKGNKAMLGELETNREKKGNAGEDRENGKDKDKGNGQAKGKN